MSTIYLKYLHRHKSNLQINNIGSTGLCFLVLISLHLLWSPNIFLLKLVSLEFFEINIRAVDTEKAESKKWIIMWHRGNITVAGGDELHIYGAWGSGNKKPQSRSAMSSRLGGMGVFRDLTVFARSPHYSLVLSQISGRILYGLIDEGIIRCLSWHRIIKLYSGKRCYPPDRCFGVEVEALRW